MTPAAAQLKGFRTGDLDLLAVLEAVLARAPKVLKSGLPNLAFVRAANAGLQQPDDESEGHGFPQVEFWLTLARELSLLEVEGDRLVVSAAADAFYGLETRRRRDRLREAWLDSRLLNEFALTPELELPGLKRAGTVDVATDVPGAEAMAAGRRAVLQFVSHLAGETPLRRLWSQMQAEAPGFVISHAEDASWRNVYYRGIRERSGRADVERSGNWQIVEGALIAFMCELPLARLGWVEFDRKRGVVEPLPETDEGGADFEIIVQPSGEILVLGDRLDAGALFRLARFALPSPEGRRRRYQLDKKYFTDALGRGCSASGLLDFLAGLSRSPLPQNVRFNLEDWSALSERIKIWPDALFIEREGVEDLAALLPAALREKLGTTVLSGGHLGCPMPGDAELRQMLPPRRKLLDYARRLPPVVAPLEGLGLSAPSEDLHLRARQVLALVATRQSADRWELDQALVTASAKAMGAEELARRLDEALSRPLSAPLTVALRSWTGEFPVPFVGQAELFLCDNPVQAELLEQQPRFRAWVERTLGRGAFLLRLGGAEAVRAMLKELGISPRTDPRKP
ncbi:MAG: hypothetical protein IT463_05775 [Planctomycetes bacterium]|nr:hypothetical protein [Planctomycetota bacterium]